jgi:hypothetical protein
MVISVGDNRFQKKRRKGYKKNGLNNIFQIVIVFDLGAKKQLLKAAVEQVCTSTSLK